MTARKGSVEAYAAAVLALPGYAPNRVLYALEQIYFHGDAQVSAEAMCRLLDCDKATLSRVVNKHMIMTPRLVLKILELTDWTLSHFRELAGMPAYTIKPTEKQIEGIRGGSGKMVKPLRRKDYTAAWQKDQHSTKRSDTDSGPLGLDKRPSSVESANWHRGRRQAVDNGK